MIDARTGRADYTGRHETLFEIGYHPITRVSLASLVRGFSVTLITKMTDHEWAEEVCAQVR